MSGEIMRSGNEDSQIIYHQPTGPFCFTREGDIATEAQKIREKIRQITDENMLEKQSRYLSLADLGYGEKHLTAEPSKESNLYLPLNAPGSEAINLQFQKNKENYYTTLSQFESLNEKNLKEIADALNVTLGVKNLDEHIKKYIPRIDEINGLNTTFHFARINNESQNPHSCGAVGNNSLDGVTLALVQNTLFSSQFKDKGGEISVLITKDDKMDTTLTDVPGNYQDFLNIFFDEELHSKSLSEKLQMLRNAWNNPQLDEKTLQNIHQLTVDYNKAFAQKQSGKLTPVCCVDERTDVRYDGSETRLPQNKEHYSNFIWMPVGNQSRIIRGNRLKEGFEAGIMSGVEEITKNNQEEIINTITSTAAFLTDKVVKGNSEILVDYICKNNSDKELYETILQKVSENLSNKKEGFVVNVKARFFSRSENQDGSTTLLPSWWNNEQKEFCNFKDTWTGLKK